MPVERMRMRPWLEEQINSCQIPGLTWVNREKRIFQIPWMHAARHGWDLEKDAPLFMRWAIHTGKYQPSVDRPDPKTWKANFRCAMNSLPDIEEVKDKSIKKGTNAFRVYKMLSFSERNSKKGKKKSEKDGRSKGRKEADKQGNPLIADWSPFGANVEPLLSIKQEVKDEFPAEGGQQGFMEEDTGPSSVLGSQSLEDDHVITSEQLPFVCQTIEVTTENEEQTVSSSHLLQISPVSSYCDSDADSLHSGTEEANEGASGITRRNYSSSILRMPPCSLPGMATFVTAAKPNFRITTLQDPDPLISYDADSWSNDYNQKSQPLVSGTTGPAHEMRASVIMKTSDVTSS